jgi:hypothetical protein
VLFYFLFKGPFHRMRLLARVYYSQARRGRSEILLDLDVIVDRQSDLMPFYIHSFVRLDLNENLKIPSKTSITPFEYQNNSV